MLDILIKHMWMTTEKLLIHFLKKKLQQPQKKPAMSSKHQLSKQLQKRSKIHDSGITLGEGTYSVVKKGVYADTGEPCALKYVKQSLYDERSIQHETQINEKFDHPNVVAFYQQSASNRLTIIMVFEYMALGSLYNFLSGGPHCNRMNTAIQHQMIRNILTGLAYIHNRGIIHCDLKPGNILIDENYTAKIADFGLARIENQVTVNPIYGTIEYSAPETFPSPYPCTRSSDIFSAGILIWEILSKCPYFFPSTMDDEQAIVAITAGKRPEIVKNHPTITLKLSSILKQCWAHTPKERPASAEQVQMMIDEAITVKHFYQLIFF